MAAKLLLLRPPAVLSVAATHSMGDCSGAVEANSVPAVLSCTVQRFGTKTDADVKD